MDRTQLRARELGTAPKGRPQTMGNCITARHYVAIASLWGALWLFICMWGWVA